MKTDRNGKCLACGSDELVEILDLGSQKPVNNLSKTKEQSERFPLTLNCCRSCGHGQLGHFCDPSDLFDDYLYASSVSGTLLNYQMWFAAGIDAVMNGRIGRVLEIASNDGLLLSAMTARELSCIGVEPSLEMSNRARAKGHTVINGYWPESSGEIDFEPLIIIGQNVLAHTPYPHEFLRACSRILSDSGVAIFQTSQADMVRNGEFDTVYHEHYSFFSENSAQILGDRSGFAFFAARRTRIHGGSAVFFFSKRQEEITRAVNLWDSNSQEDWSLDSGFSDKAREVRTLGDWEQFSRMAKDTMAQVKDKTEAAISKGRRIVAVGAAAKAITFLRAASVPIHHLLDESLDKVGRFVDGLNVSIEALGDFNYEPGDYYLVTAWNFAPELMAKIRAAGASLDSEALVYFPSIRETQLSEFLVPHRS